MTTHPLQNNAAVRTHPVLRGLITGAWLGWQIESNWAQPFLFAIYAVARPVASALIIVVMYNVITNGATQEPLFAYIFLGNALYILVSNVVNGISWAVIDDREHYRMAKQLHTAPMSYYAYLMGRGAARIAIGTISTVITILFGLVAFQLPIQWAAVDWPLFIVSTAFGLLAMQGIGLILGALTMQLPQNMWFIGEGAVAAFFIISGAIFPLDVLPAFVRPLGFFYPVTYWLELARRALLGSFYPAFPTLAAYDNTTLLIALIALSLTIFGGSYAIYRWSLHLAKEKGRLDMETSY
ncbi:MAG: ABC transporter permease [bacterium]|nr:ABC transporter permease [bacterium]